MVIDDTIKRLMIEDDIGFLKVHLSSHIFQVSQKKRCRFWCRGMPFKYLSTLSAYFKTWLLIVTYKLTKVLEYCQVDKSINKSVIRVRIIQDFPIFNIQFLVCSIGNLVGQAYILGLFMNVKGIASLLERNIF